MQGGVGTVPGWTLLSNNSTLEERATVFGGQPAPSAIHGDGVGREVGGICHSRQALSFTFKKAAIFPSGLIFRFCLYPSRALCPVIGSQGAGVDLSHLAL